MQIGLLLHAERGIDVVLEEARLADRQGFDSVWLGDHLMSGRGSWRGPDGPDGPLDSFTLMTAVAASTERVRLAWSMLNVSFRYPAMLAKVVASLDQISKGRVICSLGSGSFPEEYEAYGIPHITDHDERVQYLREVVELLDQVWTHPAPALTSYAGKHVRVANLPFNPAPYQHPRPPIWLGGESDATVQIVKDLADGWVTLTRSAATTERGDAGDRLGQVLAAPDWPTRPMAVVLQTRVFVAPTREEALRHASASLGESAGALDEFVNREIVGSPDECLERIALLGEKGANYLRLTFDDLEQQTRVADLILPRLSEVETT